MRKRIYTDSERHERKLQAAQRYRDKNRERIRRYQRLYNRRSNVWNEWRKRNLEEDRKRSRTRRANTRETLEVSEYCIILYNDVCSYCGTNENIEIDHITPLSKAGGHLIENLTAACKSCNCSKSNKFLLQFLQNTNVRG